MKKNKKSLSLLLAAFLLVGTFGITSCSGVSEEEMAQLESLRAEVSSLQKDANYLKSEKTKLEREIAEKNAKLAQCEKEIATTKANLKKIGK